MRGRDWLLLLAVTAVALVLRTWSIGEQALWTDEALTFIIAQVPALKLATAPIDPTPVFYYWLHAVLIPTDAGLIAARSISLVAGVLTIPVVFFLGRSMIGRTGAILAAAWCAVAAPLVDYSQEARAYALLVLLIMASALALQTALRSAGNRRRWALAAFVITTLLALYTHFVAVFWAGPAWLILRIDADRSNDRVRLRESWITAAALAAGAASELVRTFRYAAEASGFHWLKQPTARDFGALVLNQWLPVGGTVIAAAVLAALVALAVRHRAFLADWARRQPASAMILAALLLQPFALGGFGFFAQPIVMARTMLPSLPAVGLVIGLLLVPLAPRLRYAAGGGIIALALATTVFSGGVRDKEDWLGASHVLARSARSPSDFIIACPDWKAPALMAALRESHLPPVATQVRGGVRLLQQPASDRRDWARTYFDRLYLFHHYPEMGRPRPVERHATMPVSTVWLVESECPPEIRAAILGWAGPATRVATWDTPATAEHAGIAIEAWKRQPPGGDLPIGY